MPDLAQTYRVRVDPKTDLMVLAAQLQRDPGVALTEPNYIYSAFEDAPTEPGLPNDPFLGSSGSWGQDFADLWGLFQIDAPTAWQMTQGDGVVVAVVDSGIDVDHPDLAQNVWTNSGEVPDNGIDDDGNGFVDDVHGWNFAECTITDSGECEPSDQGPNVSDPNGHGTHVAGIISAAGNNGIGVVGVAPQAQVMAVKGLDINGDGNAANLAAAIVYAAENGATVINASWGGGRSETIRLAIDYVTQVFDVVVVAAVDNQNSPIEGGGSSPADLPRVLGVGATMHDGARAAGSFGGPLDILAPGGGDSEPTTAARPDRSILSTLAANSRLGQVCSDADGCTTAPWVVGEEYVRNGGTSMATAFVSGVVALVRSAHPDITRLGVRQALIGGADDVDPPGWDRMGGYGRINAARAVLLGGQPVAEISTPDNGAKVRERDIALGVFGTADASSAAPLQEWRLTLRSESSAGAPHELARGYGPVQSARLGFLSSALEPGRYVLELNVKDSAGAQAVDTKSILVPDQRWVAVPVPDPFFGLGTNGTLARDGSQLGLGRRNRATGNADVHLFNATSPAPGIIANAQFPRLAPPDGRFLLYYPFLISEGTGWVIRDGRDGSLQSSFIRGIYDANSPAVSEGARRFAFASPNDLDPSVGNTDRSWEIFAVDVPQGVVRQITSGPKGSDSSQAEVQDLTMTSDGRYLVFVGRTDLDVAQPPGIGPRLYLYDFQTDGLRALSLHGNSNQPLRGLRPSVTDDGGLIAYEAGSSVALFDTVTQESRVLSTGEGQFQYSRSPQISADGSKVGFVAADDFDPAVTNEDLEPELFLFDVASETYEQVTDQADYPFGATPVMDGQGRDFLLTDAGFLNGTKLRPSAIRLHPRRRGPNKNPTLTAPAAVTLSEGRLWRTELHAADADGDPLIFYAQFSDPLNDFLGQFASATLEDRGNGTAALSLTPGSNDQGKYKVIVAVFDDAGGIAQQSITFTVSDDLIAGDADCDGDLDRADLDALVHALFDSSPLCTAADANADGAVTAADLVALESMWE